jgi:RNA polymerase sigma-70 factor (ECF subfamily)
MQADDVALLSKAREYDSVALGELYDRYSGRIYSYIYYHVGDQDLAQDLTSNVFIKMLDAILADKSWQLSFTGWLYRIAHNAVVDHFRRHQQERHLPLEEELVSTLDNPVATVESMLTSESVRAAMHHLTDEQQQVIALKFAEGMSNLEVAGMMGKTEGAIKSLQYRALTALRRHLES